MKGYKHATGTFIGKGGIEIYFQTWLADRSKGIVVISHGLGEHSGDMRTLSAEWRGPALASTPWTTEDTAVQAGTGGTSRPSWNIFRTSRSS